MRAKITILDFSVVEVSAGQSVRRQNFSISLRERLRR